ncbi:MAG TPA: FAD-dependent oxidoreductase [Candidatus Limnocylindrales bacterium]|nr:FAD-dependent oxidoreductase [Candidatus Limnocylindrales bacterium]
MSDALDASSSTIAVVGASLAGLRACEALREEGFSGRIVLIGAERHLPYDRPPLSKEILQGKWEPEKIVLRRDGLGDLDLDFRASTKATSLDAAAKVVTLDDGEKVSFDGLVIATGARVRRLEMAEGFEGVHYLRSLDDAMKLRGALENAALRGAPRVAIIGAGFIGCEVAASCRQRGLDVTVIEPLAAPMVRALGRHLGGLAAMLHRDNGVDMRCATTLAAIEGDGRVERIRLGDGRTIAVDVLVIGVGVVAETTWLESSGLALEDGVLCDERCSAAPGIVAAGDVARWKSIRRAGFQVRVEHWLHAGAQGRAAALRLLRGADGVEPYDPVPFVWTDQFGVKIQMAGHPSPDDELRLVDGEFDEYRFVALFARAGMLTGVVGMRRPAVVARYQALLEQGATIEQALA